MIHFIETLFLSTGAIGLIGMGICVILAIMFSDSVAKHQGDHPLALFFAGFLFAACIGLVPVGIVRLFILIGGYDVL